MAYSTLDYMPYAPKCQAQIYRDRAASAKSDSEYRHFWGMYEMAMRQLHDRNPLYNVLPNESSRDESKEKKKKTKADHIKQLIIARRRKNATTIV